MRKLTMHKTAVVALILFPASSVPAGTWMRTVSGTGDGLQAALSVDLDQTGDAVAGGFVLSAYSASGQDEDFMVLKTRASDGAILWQQRLSGDQPVCCGREMVRSVAVDANGDAVATGDIFNQGSPDSIVIPTVIKFRGSDGAILWRTELPTSELLSVRARAVAVDHAGNVVFGGEGMTAAKLSGVDGSLIWQQPISNDLSGSVAVDENDDIIAAGYSHGEPDPSQSVDFAVVKFSGADGSVLWRRDIDGTQIYPLGDGDKARSVVVTTDGNIVAAGYTENSPTGPDFTVVKLRGTDGTEIWRYTADGTYSEVPITDLGGCQGISLEGDSAKSVAVDLDGNVVAAGGVGNSGTSCDIVVVKLSGTDGAALWRKELNGPANWADEATAIATDEVGDVLVVGGISKDQPDGGFQGDFLVAKLRGATGDITWADEIDGSGHGDIGYAIAVAPESGIIAAGMISGSSKFAVLKTGGIRKANLVLTRLGTPPGDDSLRFKGEFFVPYPFDPPLDPVTKGVRLTVSGSSGTPVDLTVLGGAYDLETRRGWKVARTGNKWNYYDKSGSQGGVVRATIENRSAKVTGLSRGAVGFAIRARNGSYPFSVSNTPLKAAVILNAAAGQLEEGAFVSGDCKASSTGNVVKCR